MTPHPQAALLTTGSELQDEIANVENLEEQVRSSNELFFPAENGGSQDVTLDVSESQRVPIQQILLSFPRVLAKTPGRTTVVQHYVYQCWRCSTCAAAAISCSLLTERIGETRTGSYVEG